MQHQHARIQAQQLRVADHLLENGTRGRRRLSRGRERIRNHPHGENQPHRSQQRNRKEKSLQARPASDHGPEHQRKRERDTDAGAHGGHGLAAVVLAGDVCQQRHQGARNGACALQRTTKNNAPDRPRESGHQAAHEEDQLAADHHGLASHTVREHAQGQLQAGLRQTIDSQRKSDQEG